MTTINGHFARLVPTGTWVNGYTPAPGLWETMDQQLSQAMNGDGGGTYAPATPVIVGGSGMQIPGGAVWTILANGELQVVGGGAAIIFSGGAGQSFGTGCNLTFQGGSSTQWISGSTSAFQSGATTHYESGSILTIDAGCNPSLAGEMVIEPGGSIVGSTAGASWLLTHGNGILITDATDPTYQSARSRTIAQPLVLSLVNPASPGYAVYGGSAFIDVVGGVNYVQVTKLINGSAIDAFTIRVFVDHSHVPIGRATVSLTRSSVIDGSVTLIGIGTVPSSIAGTFTLSVTGLGGGASSIVDDSQYTYQIGINSESVSGGIALIWYAPTVTFVNITKVGQS